MPVVAPARFQTASPPIRGTPSEQGQGEPSVADSPADQVATKRLPDRAASWAFPYVLPEMRLAFSFLLLKRIIEQLVIEISMLMRL